MKLGTVPDSGSSETGERWPGLATAAAERAVVLTSVQVEKLTTYRDLLLSWNARFNLTAITDPVDVDRRLILDAVQMLPAVDRHLAAGDSVVDIGSGGGVPAIPLAVLRPDLSFTLIEATGKKVTFLNAVAKELGLHQLTALHGRAEELGQDDGYRGRFHAGTARAVSSLPALIELLMPLVEVGGVALLPKGLEITGELEAGREAALLLNAAIIESDVMPGGESRLVVVRKTGPTPARYPRRAGIPAREPIGSSLLQPRSGSGASA